MATHAEVVHGGEVRCRRIPLHVGVIIRIAQMDLGIGQVLGIINNYCTTNDRAFKMAGGAVSIIEFDAGHVVRPLSEFAGDGADAVVVLHI